MSTADTGTTRTSLGLWPKLVLWGLVLVFGVVYLGSVKRNPAVDPHRVVPASPATQVPEVAPSLGQAGMDSWGQQAPVVDPAGGGPEVQAQQGQASAGNPEPVRAAESTAFAESLLTSDPEGESSGESTGRTDPKVESPTAVTAPAATVNSNQPPLEAAATPRKIPLAEGAAPSVAPAESPVAAPPGSMTPAFAPPLVSVPRTAMTGDDAPAAAPVEANGPGPRAPPAQAAPTASPAVGAAVTLKGSQDAERARILKEYEAMQQTAKEQMHQYWQQMRVPGPAIMPYGYPAYGPGGYPPR